MENILKRILEKIKIFFYKLKNDKISEYAAECAYFTILAFIPFIIFLISLIQYFNLDESSIIFFIKEVFPSNMRDLVYNIVDEAQSKTFGTISIAIIITLWSAGKGFYSICKGLRNVYNIEENKSNFIIRLEGTIYTLIFIILIFFLLIIRVFGNSIYVLISGKFEVAETVISYILKLRTIFFILALFILFLLIYSFVPRHKMIIKTQIVGAAFTAIAWYFTSWIFSVYVDSFKCFSNTYGSLTTIILIMMWVYTCMYIILVGAEINNLIREYKYKMLNKVKYNSK